MFGGGFFGGFPDFEGGAGGPPRSNKPVDTTSLYETLGVPKDATEAQIKKAFRQIALKQHPDRGGDKEAFQKAQAAYDILSDAKKREAYDRGGVEAVEAAENGGSAADVLFGGGRRRNRTKDIVHPLVVSLDDLCNGRVRKLVVTRNEICTKCTGSGCKPGASEVVCHDCNGQGIKLLIRRMGPMVQQMQTVCQSCGGAGKSIDPAQRCTDCAGEKVVKKKNTLEIHITKGMSHGKKIVMREQADQMPGMETGDLIFVIQQAPHDVFKRRGADLFMTKEISLQEALCGVKFVVKHLNETQYLITSAPGEIIATDMVRCVNNAGMPVDGNAFVRGNLFITFHVKFPEPGSLTPAQLAVLRSVLPAPVEPEPAVTDDVEVVTPRAVNLETEMQQAKSREGEAYESDEDQHQGPGVQCASQ